MTLETYRWKHSHRQALLVEISTTDDAGHTLPGALTCDLLANWDGLANALRACALLGPRARIRSLDHGMAWDAAGQQVAAEPPQLTSDDPDAPSLWGKQQETLDLW